MAVNLFRFKILLTGAAAVGKTSLLYRYVNNKFAEDYAATIGLNFLSKTLEWQNDKKEENQCKITIWDLAGQDKFKFVRKDFYKGANGALLIFDVTREETFKAIDDWYSELREMITLEIPFMLVGNKVDLVSNTTLRAVEIEKAKEYARKKNSSYIEASAKTGDQVNDAFFSLMNLMIKAKIK